METKKPLAILLTVALCLVLSIGCSAQDPVDSTNYNPQSETSEQTINDKEQTIYAKAIELIECGNYEEAYEQLRQCYGYKEGAVLLDDFNIIFDKKVLTGYENDEKLISKIEYEYDEQGHTTLYAVYDTNGSVVHKYKGVLEYDDKGNAILESEYDKDGTLKSKTKKE